MNNPQEFWIHPKTNALGSDSIKHEFNPSFPHYIHVVEYSHYEEAKQISEVLRDQRNKAEDSLKEKTKELSETRVKFAFLQEVNDGLKEYIWKLEKSVSGYRDALESISKNSCCDQCKEAKLVAEAALNVDLLKVGRT